MKLRISLFMAVIVAMFSNGCGNSSDSQQSAPIEIGTLERGNLDQSLLYGSCWNSCGGKSQNGNCYCDATCYSYNDCCEDHDYYCSQVPYEPCASKYCGDTCTKCSPNDPNCYESPIIKYCNEDRKCMEEQPVCGSNSIQLEISGFVTGKMSQNQGTAMDSWENACDEWLNMILKFADGQVVTYSCNNPADIATSSFQYMYYSHPTITMYVPINSQGTIQPWVATVAIGNISDYPDTAFESWKEDCYQELVELKELYGDRFLAGTCKQPVDIATSSFSYFYHGDVEIWLEPVNGMGQEIKLQGFTFGTQSDYPQQSLDGWEAACDYWRDSMINMTHDAGEFGIFECGMASDMATSSFSYFYASHPTLTFHTKYYGNQEIKPFNPEKARGSSSQYPYTAFQTWLQDCEEAYQDIKALYGNRFIAAVCKQPTDVAISSFQYLYEGDIEVWLLPIY